MYSYCCRLEACDLVGGVGEKTVLERVGSLRYRETLALEVAPDRKACSLYNGRFIKGDWSGC